MTPFIQRMCPHCGWLYDIGRGPLVPPHGCEGHAVACPGVGQIPRNPESDCRPLWRDLPPEATRPDPCDWIDMAAAGIRSRWLQWEQEAGELATSQQSTMAGEEHLHRCLVNYLRHMEANHSRAIGACRIALESELFRQGKRRRGWDKAFMEEQLRAAIKESTGEDL